MLIQWLFDKGFAFLMFLVRNPLITKKIFDSKKKIIFTQKWYSLLFLNTSCKLTIESFFIGNFRELHLYAKRLIHRKWWYIVHHNVSCMILYYVVIFKIITAGWIGLSPYIVALWCIHVSHHSKPQDMIMNVQTVGGLIIEIELGRPLIIIQEKKYAIFVGKETTRQMILKSSKQHKIWNFQCWSNLPMTPPGRWSTAA